VKKVILVGQLRDKLVRVGPNEVHSCVSVMDGSKKPDWFQVRFYGKHADQAEKAGLGVGSTILIDGRFKSEENLPDPGAPELRLWKVWIDVVKWMTVMGPKPQEEVQA
jgi:hypothetical protein